MKRYIFKQLNNTIYLSYGQYKNKKFFIFLSFSCISTKIYVVFLFYLDKLPSVFAKNVSLFLKISFTNITFTIIMKKCLDVIQIMEFKR